MTVQTFALAGALLGATLVSSPAIAAPTDSEKALAETLFRDAKALMAAKNYSQACPKLATSESYDPELGTLLNLALCHEAEGKVASAWREFREAEDWATKLNQPDRAALARTRSNALAAQVSHLHVTVREPSPTLIIKLDGEAVDRTMLADPPPIDPGAHTLESSAMNKVPNIQTFTVTSAASEPSIAIEALEDSAPPAGRPAVAPPAVSAKADSDGSTMRTLGFASLGVGAVGVGVGAIFGLKAIAEKNDERGHCTFACDSDGLSHQESSHTDATVSTVAFAVGIAAVAGGLYLTLAAPRSISPEPRAAASWWITPQVGGLVSGGQW